jgi:4-hydroxy-tetrahydrodipicolinate synthase
MGAMQTMKNNLLRGVSTALVTPFLESGEVDYDGVRRNTCFQIENGIKGLVPLGTTGETPTLADHEKERIVRIVVDEVHRAGAKVPVVVGVGTNSTQKTIENARRAAEWGADALLVVSPYYNKPTQEGLLAHFTAVAAATPLPIVVYNIKSRTGVNIETVTLQQMAKLETLVAVKEASGEVTQMMDVIERLPELAVYSGDDALALPLIAVGGQGVISVVSNLVPGKVVDMVERALSGDLAGARAAHYALLPLFRVAFCETNPAPIKFAMNRCGMAAGPLRLPLVEIGSANQARLATVLDRLA